MPFPQAKTTPVSIVRQVLARGTLLDGFIDRLDRALDLPEVSFPDIPVTSMADVEDAAEQTRGKWLLGTGPISSMMRVVENAGAVGELLWWRVRACRRAIDRSAAPNDHRSEAKPSACRLRFDLAHECGHLVMHKGVVTGDKITEDQANRFASAFLLPRSAFIHEFPRSRMLNWQAIFEMKLR